MQYDFPDIKTVNASYSHKLHELIGVAGLQQDLRNKEQIDTDFGDNWATAKDWSEDSRYEWNICRTQAQSLRDAVTNPDSGVLAWLKNYW
ncbi:hypothetical protein KEF85_02500 [Methylomonas paludis]|uniref:Uncharacterized protein n=1 Tax=Methylomonas paludis TaxID=1173101 RepID=A0A975MQ16_9GAMM|nr:hypothetical protein [Methylomonas paludis]QWF71379.1 hypothetical protein KEF85_02500 [Methylomonas paludis]